VKFLLADDQVIETTRANGAVPATRSALDRSPQLGPGQPQALFARQLQDPDVGVARPGTPAYPVISASFTTAMREITEGADVQGALDKAVSAIDADIARHDGYTPPD
jgi:multiple sugar transport system substrate-binding protein